MKEHGEVKKLFCPTCGYEIKAGIFRCPRCFSSLLPRLSCSGSCRKCKSKQVCK